MLAHAQPFARSGELSGTVLLARGEQVLFHQSFGQADHEAGTPNTPASRFHIAALGDTVTAAAIQALAAAQRVDIRDPISRYLPHYPEGGQISIEMLLLHQAGIADSPHLRPAPAGLHSLAQMVEHIASHPLRFAPGTQGEYSAAGYVLLAYLVEVISGQTYGEFAHSTLFAPLQMHATALDDGRQLIVGRARGYHPGPPPLGVRNIPTARDRHLPLRPAIYSTAQDILIWLRARLGSKQARDASFVHGWSPGEDDNGRFQEQSGIGLGFIASARYYPATRLSVVLLGNVHAIMALRVLPDTLASVAHARPVAPLPRPELTHAGVPATELHGTRYRYPGLGAFELHASAKQLYLNWLAFPGQAHLLALPDGRYLNRKDGAVLSIVRNLDADPEAIEWRLPDVHSRDGTRVLCPRLTREQ